MSPSVLLLSLGRHCRILPRSQGGWSAVPSVGLLIRASHVIYLSIYLSPSDYDNLTIPVTLHVVVQDFCRLRRDSWFAIQLINIADVEIRAIIKSRCITSFLM